MRRPAAFCQLPGIITSSDTTYLFLLHRVIISIYTRQSLRVPSKFVVACIGVDNGCAIVGSGDLCGAFTICLSGGDSEKTQAKDLERSHCEFWIGDRRSDDLDKLFSLVMLLVTFHDIPFVITDMLQDGLIHAIITYADHSSQYTLTCTPVCQG